MNSSLKFFIWNIGNPSIVRAKKQCTFLSKLDADIFILTESKDSAGCQYIKDFFIKNNFFVDYKIPLNKFDYGLIVASKYKFKNSTFINTCNYLPNRISSILLNINKKYFEIISLYVPSRDSSKEKILRKKSFLNQITTSLKIEYPQSTNRIICGDLNILERAHIPHYSTFKKWEYNFYDDIINLGFTDCFKFKNPNILDYSWVGRTGNGYRYDYAFCNENLSSNILNCFFLHNPRINKLSDHSALILDIKI